ncbi:heavy metal transport/detoxification protein (plasmid) [Nostoc sp. NIES-2111]|nr:heavy metal transport/detoxification protein [Nostoc sp. NIES-2111]
MSIKLTVPNIKGDDCAQKITESIKTMESDAQVDVDINAKTVTVESQASEETIKQIVQSAGYAIEGY